jgi:class 3 adenylate cyclase
VTGSSQSLIVEVRQPGRVPLRLHLGGTALEIGRDCPGLVLTDPRISRRHLSLQAVAGTVRVTDLGSRNGTFVGDARIHGTHLLAPGDSVRLGVCTVTLVGDETAIEREPAGAPGAGTTSLEMLAAPASVVPIDMHALPEHAATLTIVCSDIADVARRAADLGAERWDSALETHNAVVRRFASRHEGLEIRAHRDGFLHGFLRPGDAVAFVVDVQRALHALARSRPADTVRVRGGAHTAELIVGHNGELLGGAFVIAALVGSAARSGEFLVTGIVRDLLGPRADVHFGRPRLVTLQGCRQHVVHPVQWAS